MARLGLTRQFLKLQSTLKSLIADVRGTWLGAAPIKSNSGEVGMANSLGAGFSPCCEYKGTVRTKLMTATITFIMLRFIF